MCGLFCEIVAPPGSKIWLLSWVRACLGGLKTHVILSYQWQVFCKQPVKYVTLLIDKSALEEAKSEPTGKIQRND